jgi:hypothetical protein
VPFLALDALGDLTGPGAVLAVLVIALWAEWRWQGSRAALAAWRSRRDEAIREELRVLRERDGDA